MNCKTRLLPFAILAAAAFARQQAEIPTVQCTLLVQTEAASAGPHLEGLLAQVLNNENGKQAVLQALHASLPADSAATDIAVNCFVRPLTATSAFVELTMKCSAGKAPAFPAAASDAIALVVKQRVDAVLTRPTAQAAARALERAEARRQDAERRVAEAQARLDALGIDTFATDQAALADLQRQEPQVELDLRTEEAVGVQLQQQLDEARSAAANARERLERVDAALTALQGKVGRDAPTTALQQELSAQQVQLELSRTAFLAAQKALDAVQQQATASSLALQRHRSRAGVLRELIADLHKRVAAGAASAHTRMAAERDFAAAIDALAAARDQFTTAQEQLRALPDVEVRPWQ